MIPAVVDGDPSAYAGIAGAVAATAYAIKMLADSRRESRTAGGKASTAVADAAEANGILLGALQEERAEVQRLSTEVEALRQSNTQLYRDMQQQRREYERELQGMRDQLLQLTGQLEDLQTRIRAGLPKHD